MSYTVIKCSKCGKNLNDIGQDNMSYKTGLPVCEDCNDLTIRHDGCPDDCSQCGSYCVYD